MRRKKVKRRKLRRGALAILMLLVIIVISAIMYLLLNFNLKFIGVKSIHEDALKYQQSHCLAFYPEGENGGYDVAKSLCDGVDDDRIYDYILKPYGDYTLVDYGQGDKYFIDKDNKLLSITSSDINDEAKQIISDYLRYQAKKGGEDRAYTLEFIEKSHVSKLDLSDATYDVEGENLLVNIPSFETEVLIPLKYIQEPIGKNFGYADELYQKPRYVDPNRPMIALTFDDGPYIPTTSAIVDALEYYDSVGTFFCLGNRLRPDKEIPFIKEAIEKGNEYASHTQSHRNLTNLDSASVLEEIVTPANDLKNGFGYEITLYRPPYGARNSSVDEASPYPAILWNVDSEDWKSRNSETIKSTVYAQTDDKDIVLFHDIYEFTANAVIDIIPEFISQGYQLVTVTELMQTLDIDPNINMFSGK